MIAKLPNITVFRESAMTPDDVAGFGADHVVIATGAQWRRDGIGVNAIRPGRFAGAITPDDLAGGAAPDPAAGPVVIYDDEHYFMGGALAEQLACAGHEVHLVTTAPLASAWTVLTNEQDFIQARLIAAGVRIHPLRALTAWQGGAARLECVHGGPGTQIDCGSLVLVTGRLPRDGLYEPLLARAIAAVRVGDCLQPSSIADAVYSAHRFARELGTADADLPPRRERPPER
jgi:dimethylamine/trimethylamine dehydrogenase